MKHAKFIILALALFFAIAFPATAQVVDKITVATFSPPAARTSTVTATGVDIAQYVGRLAITQHVGTVSGTSPTLDGKLQESSDNSTWSDISGATFTQVTASTAIQTIYIQTRATKRYIRYVGTIGGTSPSFGLAVTIQGQKQTQ